MESIPISKRSPALNDFIQLRLANLMDRPGPTNDIERVAFQAMIDKLWSAAEANENLKTKLALAAKIAAGALDGSAMSANDII